MSISTAATITFDTGALRRSIESRDAAGQLALYADAAVLTLVDRDHPPSRPQVFSGDAVAAYLEDVCARDMTHTVSRAAVAGDTLAFEVECAYPDGSRVLCQAFATLADGQITGQRGVQVWDA